MVWVTGTTMPNWYVNNTFLEDLAFNLAEIHSRVPKNEPKTNMFKIVNSNFHLYALQVKENPRFDRYDLYTYLENKNYAPMVHYIPVHLLSYYKQRYGHKLGDFPIAENYYARTISIPLYPSLTNDEVEKVVKNITSFVESKY